MHIPENRHLSATKLFLGGLPPTLTEEDLYRLLEGLGESKINLIKKRNSNLNDGYAFVFPAD